MTRNVRRASSAGALVIALAVLAKVASAPGQSFFLAVFVDDILVDTGLSRSGFSALYAVATVASATMVIGVGRLIDRVGIRAVWLLVAAGLAAACATLSVAGGAAVVLLSLCLMRGFGQGSFPLLGTVLIASNFEAKRGRAMAIATQGITLAGVILPLIAAALIAAVGWRTGLQLVALVIAAAILPLGLLTHRFGGRSNLGPQPPSRLAETLRKPGVPSLLVILAASPLITTALVLHSVSLLGGLGLTRGEAAFALGAMAAFVALGAVIGGALADRCKPPWGLSAIGVALLLAAGLPLTGAAAMGFVAFAALGLAQGLSSTANGTVWARVYGITEIGRLQGLASSGQIAGAALGPLVLALSAAATGGYVVGLLVLVGLALAAVIAGWQWRFEPKSLRPVVMAAPKPVEEAA